MSTNKRTVFCNLYSCFAQTNPNFRFRFIKRAHRRTFVQREIRRINFSPRLRLHWRLHYGCFLGFLSKKYLRQIPIQLTRRKINEKIKALVFDNFKSYTTTLLPLFFQVFWHLELRFVSDTFWTKLPKSSHWRLEAAWFFGAHIGTTELNVVQ